MKETTLASVAEDFTENPDIAAVFGSYDDEPAEKNFLSQYKNLVHHYVHQQSSSEAVTFWAGCGAIRKEIFFSVGGFDGKKYAQDGNAIQLYKPFDTALTGQVSVLNNLVAFNTGTGSTGLPAGHGIYWIQDYVEGGPVALEGNLIASSGGWGIKLETTAGFENAINNLGIHFNKIFFNTDGGLNNTVKHSDLLLEFPKPN